MAVVPRSRSRVWTSTHSVQIPSDIGQNHRLHKATEREGEVRTGTDRLTAELIPARRIARSEPQHALCDMPLRRRQQDGGSAVQAFRVEAGNASHNTTMSRT